MARMLISKAGRRLAVLNVEEVALKLNVSVREVDHWVAHGLVDVVHSSGGCWVTEQELHALEVYFEGCPGSWSAEQVMWYRFFHLYRDALGAELERNAKEA